MDKLIVKIPRAKAESGTTVIKTTNKCQALLQVGALKTGMSVSKFCEMCIEFAYERLEVIEDDE
ncbi:MAG TPA: hypothetical protein PKI60_08095 [Oscillospiraceae bacterium]|nr:hypothetical protein [Oscillospiraceae bacterium]